jgi:hypothetical protein
MKLRKNKKKAFVVVRHNEREWPKVRRNPDQMRSIKPQAGAKHKANSASVNQRSHTASHLLEARNGFTILAADAAGIIEECDGEEVEQVLLKLEAVESIGLALGLKREADLIRSIHMHVRAAENDRDELLGLLYPELHSEGAR